MQTQLNLNMTDEFIVVTLIVLFILAWFFAIRKTICHYKLIKESEISLLTKFFILGIPFFILIPNDVLINGNKHLYRKGLINLLFLVVTCFFFIFLINCL